MYLNTVDDNFFKAAGIYNSHLNNLLRRIEMQKFF